MIPHPAALEAYNRATFDPPTPEMQMGPAEDIQSGLPLAGATVPFWIYPVAAFFAFAAVCIWAAS